MATDDLASAAAVGRRVDDPRVTVFHDPAHLLGRAMARTLGWKQHVAWDTYFVYRPGRRWTGGDPPMPDEWFHQLKDRELWAQTAEAELGSAAWTQHLAATSEADPTRFRTGAALRHALTEALTRHAVTPADPDHG